MDIKKDIDPVETAEWIDSLEELIKLQGHDRTIFILEKCMIV